MANPPETTSQTTYTTQTTVACDGGELGHPRVFLNLGHEKQVDCPYCGHRFVRQADPQAASAGH
ncbi:MAG: zinc-finger domain-containing protein [Alphaproteobacteria bacterium]